MDSSEDDETYADIYEDVDDEELEDGDEDVEVDHSDSDNVSTSSANENVLLESRDNSSEDEESLPASMRPQWPPPCATEFQEDTRNKKKPGIVYLSSIPPGYNVSGTIGFFSQFGRVGRVFLQPDAKEKSKRKDKLARNFTEGWIEFMSKRVAKDVAGNLNNTAVGGKKRSKAHDVIWNIKYLPKFKWTHLSERLAYEKAVHHQRLRTEISQAKREADYFKANVERSRRLERSRKRPRLDSGQESSTPPPPAAAAAQGKVYQFRQKETDDVIKKRQQRKREMMDTDEVSPQHKTRKANSKKKSKKSYPMIKSKKSTTTTKKSKSRATRTSSSGGADRTDFLQSMFGKT